MATPSTSTLTTNWKCRLAWSCGTLKQSCRATGVFLYKRGEGAGGVAGFSDLFRFQLLHEYGGWWVDTDVICLSKRDRPSPKFISDGRITAWSERAIMRLPKGSELALELYEAAERAGDRYSVRATSDPGW